MSLSSFLMDLVSLFGDAYFVFGVGALVFFCIVWRRGSAPIAVAKDGIALEEKESGRTGVAAGQEQAALGKVEPLKDFDWKTTEPLKLRPFKPKYHLTMALETTDVNNLIVMDKNYLDRVTLRRNLIAEHPTTTVGHLSGTQPAITELYEFLTQILLPARWPQMFSTSPSDAQLRNLVTGHSMPLKCPASATEALFEIGRNIDEDVFVLLPSDDGDGHTLKAFTACFPSGFDVSRKIGQKLRDIHKPVPKYKEKLAMSMDRYFDKLEVGKFVRRVNWSVMTNDELFTPFAITHFHEGTHSNADHPDAVDVANTYQRTEMQTLFRLPHSGAIVFLIKTYMYPIQQIKDDGYGEEFAAAIEGLERGNVPDMYFYKRGPIWGASVKEFLRS